MTEGDKAIPVRVAVRIRPLSNKEEDDGCLTTIKVIPGRPQVHMSSMDRAYTYDFAFDSDSLQEEVYGGSVSGMIPRLFEGYNATVLAYGQTGSGKTYSMGTAHDTDSTTEQLAGVIPRAVSDIFSEISSRADKVDVSVSVSFVELYREQLYDLLSSKSAKKEDCVCDLREDPVRGVVIPGLTELSVSSVEQTMRRLEAGSSKRVTAATAMNNTSSRSHAIFTVLLTITGKEEGGNTTVSKFHLVDLAGSERQKKTQASGDRFKEGTAINQGLLALGNVIAALGEEGGGRASHIPYRNSKLTRLLQDSLGGNSYTLMVACVSPADSNADETLSTLRYADRARQIKNKPIVNVTGNDAEINRLRAENQELRLKLLEAVGGGSSEGGASKEAMQVLKEENRSLSRALNAAQEELTHMNEKVIMHETSNERLKTKFAELMAALDQLMEKNQLTGKGGLADIRSKVRAVMHMHEEAEKSIVDYDVSRADFCDVTFNLGDASAAAKEEEEEEEEEHDEIVAEHAVKRNAITTELQNLNRALAQKEKLAAAMQCSEHRLQEMRREYESSLKSLETEVEALQKEKDELHQRQRNAVASEAASKVSEQRRKRIQELETKLGELRKKVLEQQRAIKLNERSVAQVKKLAEEIKQLKQAKVKLIRQFKEDAEKLRQYKREKEKEVQKLRQNERKQQARMAKMENLHTKKENVLRRKVEEALNANKRLKDVLERQKAARADQHGSSGRMAGAGERVRSWVNGEVNVVVSVKEATQSREVLLSDRRALNRELTALKVGMRGTMSGEEMQETRDRMEKLKEDLQLRNAQITQLQKQIADLEQDVPSREARFDQLKTLTESKIALEHLFDRSVEQAMFVSHHKAEFEELRQLYNEAVKNTNVLEREIAQMKHDHESHLTREKREHEERVLALLNSAGAATSASAAHDSVAPRVAEEIRKHSKLNEELARIGEENERLRKQMLGKEMAQKEKETQRRLKRRSNRYTADEFFREADAEDGEEMEEQSDDDDDDMDNDPDWEKTPLCKRIRKLRESSNATLLTVGAGGGSKRKPSTIEEEEEEGEDGGFRPKPPKRFSGNSSSSSGCRCKSSKCRTKQCRCRKFGAACSSDCGCDKEACGNKNKRDGSSPEDAGSDNRSALSDISNDTANTNSLLNDTYTHTVGDAGAGAVNRTFQKEFSLEDTPRKPSRNTERTFFKSPMAPADDDGEEEENSRPVFMRKAARGVKNEGVFPYPAL